MDRDILDRLMLVTIALLAFALYLAIDENSYIRKRSRIVVYVNEKGGSVTEPPMPDIEDAVMY